MDHARANFDASVFTQDLTGRVAVVTGGSRGIGRECILALARLGCNVCCAAKTTSPHPTLPGTIYTVCDEARALGVEALPFKTDLRDAENIEAMVAAVVAKFGRIDILINNASALWWQDIADTPVKKYDLINQVNARGTFLVTKACLPHMAKNGFGRVICMSPPIRTRGMAGHTAYNIAKFGMTIVALGVAEEYAGQNITAHSLWPATVIESLASINFKLGDSSNWRKATILADCVVGLVCDPDGDFTGRMLIDDAYLRERQGFGDQDLVQYRCDPDVEPPRLLAMAVDPSDDDKDNKFVAKRGQVKSLGTDMTTDNITRNRSKL